MHIKNSLILVFLLFWKIWPTFSFAQVDSLLPSPTLDTKVEYSISNGLANNCLSESFIDSKGRIWLNPCPNTAEEMRMNFFQFDGEKSLFYDLIPNDVSEGEMSPVWQIQGETSKGYLYGKDLQNKRVFYWYPDFNEKHFYSIQGKSQLLNIVENPSGGILVVTLEIEEVNDLTMGKYHLIQLYKGEEKELGSIRLEFGPDAAIFNKTRKSFPFEIHGKEVCFFHHGRGLVKANLELGTVDFFSWKGLIDSSTEKELIIDENDFGTEWNMVSLGIEELLLFLGQGNGFFRLNLSDNKLFSDKNLNQYLIKREHKVFKLYFAKDNKENLLIVSGNYDPWSYPTPTTNRKALIIDQKGNWYDYLDHISKLALHADYDFHHDGNYFSADFFSEIGSTVRERGLSFIKIEPKLSISRIDNNPGYKISGITSLDSLIFVNSDKQVNKRWRINGRMRSFRLTEGEFVRARSNSSFFFKDGKLWMSADFYQEKRMGLQWYDPTNNHTDFIPLNIPFEKFIFLNDSELILFQEAKDGNNDEDLGKVFIVNLEDNEIKPLIINNEAISLDAKVNDLFLQGDSTLWVGAQNGLWQFDLKNQKIEHFTQSPILKGQNILAIHKEDNGSFWLGTGTSGILIFEPKSGEVNQISIKKGLSNNTVFGMLTDKHGNHWVSTLNGITILDSVGKVIYKISEANGLISNTLNQQSFHKTADGRMIFGGFGGFVILYPDRILQEISQTEQHPIYLTGLEYFDTKSQENISHVGAYYSSEPLQIPAAERYLNIDFALSEYVNLKDQLFSYRLLPSNYSEKDSTNIPWIGLGSSSQLSLKNMASGNYIIQIKGIDSRSNETIVPLEIPIQVAEFFYKQWWFYFLCSLPFIFGAWIYLKRIFSERIRLEQEIQLRTAKIQKDKELIVDQAKQLQELDRSKSRFFTNISHEFRTPLTVILGVADQIKDNDKERTLIKRNGQILLNLINQILQLRKLESGTEKSKFIQGDILRHIQYIVESFHSLAEEKGIIIHLKSNREKLVLDYDPEKTLHIVSNLLTNAIKFSPREGNVTIEINPINDDTSYEISVTDYGIGIPEDKLPRVFDRFYQVDDELSRTGSGTGIGLTLVQELVKILNGEIMVESTVGEKTKFTVQLPISNQAAFEDSGSISPVLNLALETSIDDGLQKIKTKNGLPLLLIVEDNADVRKYLVSCLEENFRIILTNDGQEGIDRAIESVPDLIISDVMMPKVNGFILCDKLKNDFRTSHIPIILLTAKADVDSRITGIRRGADAYMAKPFNKVELYAQINNLLLLRINLSERYSNLKKLQPSGNETLKLEDDFIIKLREAILNNLTEDNFGVQELCKLVFMSRTQLHNKVKSLTNKSASHFIRQVRMEKAGELLCETDLNISQIALEVGIENLSYFSRTFSEETGLSPLKYREQNSMKQ